MTLATEYLDSQYANIRVKPSALPYAPHEIDALEDERLKATLVHVIAQADDQALDLLEDEDLVDLQVKLEEAQNRIAELDEENAELSQRVYDLETGNIDE